MHERRRRRGDAGDSAIQEGEWGRRGREIEGEREGTDGWERGRKKERVRREVGGRGL